VLREGATVHDQPGMEQRISFVAPNKKGYCTNEEKLYGVQVLYIVLHCRNELRMGHNKLVLVPAQAATGWMTPCCK
jgi:hypothetical protein